MNKYQALQYLHNGDRVRYRTWWLGKYIVRINKQILDEEGKKFKPAEILTEHEGWELYREDVHGKPPMNKSEKNSTDLLALLRRSQTNYSPESD